mgnify:FL=1
MSESTRNRLFVRYGSALAAVGVAAALTVLQERLFDIRAPYAWFYLAAIVTAMAGGVGPGVVTVVLSVAVVAGALRPSMDDTVAKWMVEHGVVTRSVLFVMLAGVSALLCGGLYRSQRRLARQLEAARESEARFRTFFETSPIGISIARDGRMIYANSHFAEMFGYEHEGQIVGRPITDFLSERVRSVLAARNERRQAGASEIRAYEAEGLRKDGSAFPFRVSASRIDLSDGPATIGFFIDISQQYRYEQALRDNQERLQAALSAAHMGTWRYDFRTGIEVRGPSLNNLLGLEPVPTGQPVTDFLSRVHPDDRPLVDQAIQGCARGDEYDVSFRIVRADGTIRWVRDRGVLARDSSGAPLYMTGAMVDVTALREAQHALWERERELERILSNLPSVIARIDRQMRYQFVNESIRRVTGYPPSHFLGKSIFEAQLNPQSVEVGARLIRQVFETGQPAEAELVYPSPDRERAFQFRVVPEMDADGNIVSVLAISHDVTASRDARAELNRAIEQEQIARRQAEAASRAKDQFLAVLSHELRTPLTPVLLTIGAMEADPGLSPEMREDLAMIRRNVELETKLIDDLLDVTRITNGKLRLQLTRTGVHALIRHVAGSLQAEADARRLTIDLDLQASDDVVNGDPARLQQVFWNLLKNAIKFSHEGGRIQVRTAMAEPRMLQVEVIDEGIGIEPQGVDRLFEAFEQGSSWVTRQFGGLGLGLAISRAIMELHGGTITAASDGVNRGATFTVTLPVVAPVERLLNRIESGSIGSGQGRRVLLVEDHRDTRQMLQRYLQAAGFEVLIAGSVAAALKVAAEQPFDVLVSDIGLPDASGFDLMRQVRCRKPVPGIAISGYGMEADIRNSHDAGFFAHLTKPVDPKHLQATIHQAIAANGA